MRQTRQALIVAAVVVVLVAAASFIGVGGASGVVTLKAQTLPIARTVAWDPNPASDGVTGYVVRLDGAIVGSPTTTSQPITITALGAHTISVVAVNQWAESTPASLSINVVGPGKPGNVRIQ